MDVFYFTVVPDKVESVNVAMDSSGSLIVFWYKSRDEDLLRYNVSYRKTQIGNCQDVSQPADVLVLPATASSANITGLDSWSRYQISVVAVNAAGGSVPANTSHTTPETGNNSCLTTHQK